MRRGRRGYDALIVLVAVISMAATAACGGGKRIDVHPVDTADLDSLPSVRENGETLIDSVTLETWKMADSVMSAMTLEEKVGHCFMPTLYARNDAASLERMRMYIYEEKVGGVVLLQGDLQGAMTLSEMAAQASVPLVVAIDAEWGLGMRLEDAPGFPRNGQLPENIDEQLLFDYGVEVARECRRIGIGMVLGPVLDVVENPRGVIGNRSFGGNPERVATLGVAYAKGLEAGNVLSVAKHFPGHGSPSGDSHKTLPVVERSRGQLDSIDLHPFVRYVDAGLSGVMAGHLAVPAVDSLNLPAAVSPAVLQGLLRDSLRFNGLILTDALNMEGASGYDASAAIAAGADIVIGPADTRKEIEKVIADVADGKIEEKVISDRCRRILFYKFLRNAGCSNEVDTIGAVSLQENVRGSSDTLRIRLLHN